MTHELLKGGAERPFFLAPKLYCPTMRTIICAVLIFGFPNWAFAADDVPEDLIDIPPGPDNIVILNEGEKAPFSGQLYDNPTASRWGGWLLQYRYKLTAGIELQKKLCASETKLLETRLGLEKESKAILLEDYSLALDEESMKIRRLEHPPFFRTAWFGFTMGITVSVVAISAGAIFLAGS